MNNIIYVGKHAITMEVSRHIHNSWELIYYISGSGTMLFDDCKLDYSANSVIIIPPMLPHSNESEEGFTNIHINMTDASFTTREPMVIPGDANGFMLNAFTAAHYHYSSNAAGRVQLLPVYGQLIATAVNMYHPENRRSDLVQQIMDNIVAYYPDSSYDLNGYLQSLPFSFEYVKKLFKKEVGLTPLQYLTDKRLENAAGNLSISCNKVNISEIARLSGFNDPLYFSRLFKQKYGVSPRNYAPDKLEPPLTDSAEMKIML